MFQELEIFNKLIVFLINAFGVSLGVWVLLTNWRATLNRRFIFMTVCTLLWINSAYLGFSSKDPAIATFWYKINVISTLITALSFYAFFILSFLKERKHLIFNNFILVFAGLLIILTAFTDTIIKGSEMKDFGMEIIFGNYIGIYFIFSFSFLFLMFIWMIKKYFVLPTQEKQKIQYFLIGILLWFFFNIVFNIFIPIILNTTRYQHFGDYSLIFLLGFTAYAIVRRQLFGIKVVLTALFVVLIAILLLLNTLLFTESTPFQILNGVIFLAFLFFGYYLIRSVQMEIKRREEMEKLSLQLKAANVELDKLSKSKSEFISIASHQLRTPLTAVKGYISMMMEKLYGKPPQKMKKPLENVYNSNERLIRLVNDLLNLSRLDAGKIEFSPELISLEEMVSGIVEELKINAEKKGLYMKMVKSSEPLPKIMADQDKLRQVILNIVDNAIKYTKEGGITFELKKLNDQEKIRISDTGEGMNEKELNSLFQMFSRATAGTQLHAEGAGLGLYVAKQFTEMHGGKIWAESSGKGKGSTFIIQLPIKLDLELIKGKTKIIIKAPNK